MGGAPPLLAMNGRGYTVLNESSASGQSTRTSSMGGALPLLGVNGRGYTVLHVHNESSASTWTGSRGGGTWQLLKLGETGRHNESSASGQAPEEEGQCKGLSSGSPLPMEFHSSSYYQLLLHRCTS